MNIQQTPPGRRRRVCQRAVGV